MRTIVEFESEESEETQGVIRIRKSEVQTTQWQKVQKDKQQSTKHTHKTKDRVTRTPLKTKGQTTISKTYI